MQFQNASVDMSIEKTPSTSFENVNDQLRAELDVLLEEYKLCTTRMIREVDSDEKGFEFNLVGIGALIVAITFAIDKKAYFLLLLLSLPFHILTWALARRNMWTSFLVAYMSSVLTPRINRIIGGTEIFQPGNQDAAHFLSWEKYHYSRLDDNPYLKITLAMPLIGRAVLQFAITIITVLAYFLFKQMDSLYNQTLFDDILIWVNIVFFAVSLFNLGSTTLGWLKTLSSTLKFGEKNDKKED